MSTATATATVTANPRRAWTKGRIATHVFLAFMAFLWLIPLLYAVMASLRDYQFTAQFGYLSFGGFTLDNYVTLVGVDAVAEFLVIALILYIPVSV